MTPQRHSREGGNPFIALEQALIWVPACRRGRRRGLDCKRFADFFTRSCAGTAQREGSRQGSHENNASIHLRGGACAAARSANAPLPAHARAFLPRRTPARRPGRSRDGVRDRFLRCRGGLRAALGQARQELPQRGRGPRKSDRREHRDLDLGAQQASAPATRPRHRLRDARLLGRIRGQRNRTVL